MHVEMGLLFTAIARLQVSSESGPGGERAPPDADTLSVELHAPFICVSKDAPACAPHVGTYVVLHWAL